MHIHIPVGNAAGPFIRAEGGKQATPGLSFVPEVLFQGNYYPICGHYFWDNDFGAQTVCEALGFKHGQVRVTGTSYNKDAMPVGKCNSGESLDKCTAGGNAFGNLDTNNGWCNKGQEIGVEVACVNEDAPPAPPPATGSKSVCLPATD